MSKIWIPIVFQISAFLVGIVEVIIPSFGILTIIALALFGYSWYYIIQELPQLAVWIFLLADVIIVPLFIFTAFSILKISPLAHSKRLKHGTGLNKSSEPGREIIGMKGLVESQLKPTGKALIGNKLLEVCSEGEIIKKNTEIRVIDVAGNKIIVEPIKE